MSRLLDFVIVGAQKGGSTSLATAVGQHPRVWMPAEELPLFRDPVFSPGQLSGLDALLDARIESRTGIKCPDYLGCSEVPGRLHAYSSRLRIVICLRDPVHRAVSAYFWYVRWGILPLENPSVGLRKVLDGTYGENTPMTRNIVDWGRYATHIDTYLEHFEPSALKVVLSDDMRRDLQGVFEDVFRFLEVDPMVRPSLTGRQANEGVYSPTRLRLLRTRNRLFLRYQAGGSYATIEPPEGLLKQAVCKSVAGVDQYLLRHLVQKTPATITDDVTSRLRDLYRSDSIRLARMLGRDLSNWTR